MENKEPEQTPITGKVIVTSTPYGVDIDEASLKNSFEKLFSPMEEFQKRLSDIQMQPDSNGDFDMVSDFKHNSNWNKTTFEKISKISKENSELYLKTTELPIFSDKKPIHVKPSFYAFCFESLKEIAMDFGYNLVLHGSMNRDLDLVAIPWQLDLGNPNAMIEKFAEKLGGKIMSQTHNERNCFPHGRLSYVINLRRTETQYKPDSTIRTNDAQYYLDISVIQPAESILECKTCGTKYFTRDITQQYCSYKCTGVKNLKVEKILGEIKTSFNEILEDSKINDIVNDPSFKAFQASQNPCSEIENSQTSKNIKNE